MGSDLAKLHGSVLAYGCNDNKEDNSCVKEGGESVTYPPTERLNRRGWTPVKGDSNRLEHSTSFFLLWKAWRAPL